MKKSIHTLILFFSLIQVINAQSPDWSWVKTAGWIGGVGGSERIACDNNGNIYAAGDFASPSITFGSITLTNASWNKNSTLCLVKYDSTGNVLWAKTAFGHFNYIKPNSIAADKTGNIYVAGYFNGDSAIFGNVALRNPFKTGLYDNMFIVKYDATGKVLWGKCADGKNYIGSCYANGVAADSSGNVYVVGNFSSLNIIFKNDTLLNSDKNLSADNDIFILKFGSAGNLIWAKSQGGLGGDIANSIANNGSSIYLTGNFTSKTLSLGTITLNNVDTTKYHNNVFISKMDTAGNVIWAESNKTNGNSVGVGIASSPNGLIYLTGTFDCSKIVFGNCRS